MIEKSQHPETISYYRFENFLNVYSENGIKFFNHIRGIDISWDDNPDIHDRYTVSPKDTWYLISFKYYGTMDLWWLVCIYNKIQNPTKFPVEGTVLRLLKNQYVQPVIDQLKKQIRL